MYSWEPALPAKSNPPENQHLQPSTTNRQVNRGFLRPARHVYAGLQAKFTSQAITKTGTPGRNGFTIAAKQSNGRCFPNATKECNRPARRTWKSMRGKPPVEIHYLSRRQNSW